MADLRATIMEVMLREKRGFTVPDMADILAKENIDGIQDAMIGLEMEGKIMGLRRIDSDYILYKVA